MPFEEADHHFLVILVIIIVRRKIDIERERSKKTSKIRENDDRESCVGDEGCACNDLTRAMTSILGWCSGAAGLPGP